MNVNIGEHPIWSKVSPIKKPFHLMRISLAKQFSRLFARDKFIGITGTVGKTTAAQACLNVLSQKYRTISTIPSLDSIFNIPITLLKVKPNIQKVILEMGIEYIGEMDFYLSMIKPKIAIVTKISYQHSEFLGGVDEIIAEKGKLLEVLPTDGIAILNADDVHTPKLAEMTKAQVVYFGTNPKTANIWADKVRIEDFKTIFGLNYGVERVEIEYPLLGEHQIYPALAAASLGVVEGISLVTIKKGLEKTEPVEHRLQAVSGPNGSVILDDTYNAAPVAVEAAIETLMRIPARRKILVLGEMRELGQYTEELHKQLAALICKEKLDLVLLGPGDTKYIAEELISLGFSEEKVAMNLQNPQIVSYLLKTLVKGDVCLIKGARSNKLDEVVKRITKK